MIRKYTESDFEDVLNLIDLNIPKYFEPKEKMDFIDYLLNKREDYFVCQDKGKTIACAGINYFYEDRIARLSWDMVHPDYHRKGIGRELTEFRISLISSDNKIDSIVVRTSQHANRFYEKLGFELIKIVENYWADSFHLYEMHLVL
jgi:ribosomal protein S18 acetylase RimI-like enzyme